MKTTSFSVFLAFLFVSPGFAGIRGTEWGMVIEQVKRIEKGRCEEGVRAGLPYLIYEKEILNVESTITYEFDQGRRLYRIVYALTPEGPDTARICGKVGEILTSKYGKPRIQLVGIATSRSVWEGEGTKIELSHRFSSPSFHVVYSNPAMEEDVSRWKVLLLTEKSDPGDLERSKEIKKWAKDF